MSLFTPVSGLLGGSLIGLAASTLLVVNGDILGFSGIISSVTTAPKKAFSSTSQQWKIVFVSAFLITSNLFANFAPQSYTKIDSASQNHSISSISYVLAAGGFLVGFGTKLSNGCTSGHGICGLARLSIRSFAAVITFMTTGIVTTTFVLPLTSKFLLISAKEHETNFYPTKESTFFSNTIVAAAGLVTSVLFLRKIQDISLHDTTTDNAFLKQKKQVVDKKKLYVAAFCGSLSSIGLAVSGMIKPEKILGFLDMKGIQRGYYDPTLIMVMGGGLAVSALGYHYVEGYSYFGNEKALACPLVGDTDSVKFNVPMNKEIDAKLLLGSAIFGIGWGLSGFCPGPALYLAGAGFPKVLTYFWPANIVGCFIADTFEIYIFQ